MIYGFRRLLHIIRGIPDSRLTIVRYRFDEFKKEFPERDLYKESHLEIMSELALAIIELNRKRKKKVKK